MNLNDNRRLTGLQGLEAFKPYNGRSPLSSRALSSTTRAPRERALKRDQGRAAFAIGPRGSTSSSWSKVASGKQLYRTSRTPGEC